MVKIVHSQVMLPNTNDLSTQAISNYLSLSSKQIQAVAASAKVASQLFDSAKKTQLSSIENLLKSFGGVDFSKLALASKDALTVSAKVNIGHTIEAFAQLQPMIQALAQQDFRISVVSQELEQVVSEEPETVAKKLLFEDITKPANELEAQLFEILKQQRELLNKSVKLFEKIDNSQGEDITDKRYGERSIYKPEESSQSPNKNQKKHDSPAFVKNKFWYEEVILSNLIGLLVAEFYKVTIGSNPANTLTFALLLACLLRFIKPK